MYRTEIRTTDGTILTTVPFLYEPMGAIIIFDDIAYEVFDYPIDHFDLATLAITRHINVAEIKQEEPPDGWEEFLGTLQN